MGSNRLYREEESREALEALPDIAKYTLESLKTQAAIYDAKSLVRWVDRIYKGLKDGAAEAHIISAVESVKDALDSSISWFHHASWVSVSVRLIRKNVRFPYVVRLLDYDITWYFMYEHIDWQGHYTRRLCKSVEMADYIFSYHTFCTTGIWLSNNGNTTEDEALNLGKDVLFYSLAR